MTTGNPWREHPDILGVRRWIGDMFQAEEHAAAMTFARLAVGVHADRRPDDVTSHYQHAMTDRPSATVRSVGGEPMTATLTRDGFTVHHVELSGRKAYVARLAGTDPTYGFSREWCDKVRTVNGRRGWCARITTPGWYEAVTYTPGTWTRKVRYYANDGRTLERIPDGIASAFLVKAFAGPNPGEPGAWRGDWCHCGDEVRRYTPAGFPRCDHHWTPEEHSESSRRIRRQGPDRAPDTPDPF